MDKDYKEKIKDKSTATWKYITTPYSKDEKWTVGTYLFYIGGWFCFITIVLPLIISLVIFIISSIVPFLSAIFVICMVLGFMKNIIDFTNRNL